LGFLVLEEQGVLEAVAAQEDDQQRVDASHSTTFRATSHDPVPGEEWFAVIGEGVEVESSRAAERLRNGATSGVCVSGRWGLSSTMRWRRERSRIRAPAEQPGAWDLKRSRSLSS